MVLFYYSGLQALVGILAMVLAFQFVSEDIEAIIISFVASQSIYVAFATDILHLVGSVV